VNSHSNESVTKFVRYLVCKNPTDFEIATTFQHLQEVGKSVISTDKSQLDFVDLTNWLIDIQGLNTQIKFEALIALSAKFKDARLCFFSAIKMITINEVDFWNAKYAETYFSILHVLEDYSEGFFDTIEDADLETRIEEMRLLMIEEYCNC